jgi:Flp pilus assembly protein CpaB
MTVGPILAGDFIMPAKLVDSDGHSGVAFVVPKGKVVITLPASDILTTGAVHPGDTIDLLVTIKPDREKNANANATTVVPGAAAAPSPVASPTPVGGADVEVGTTQTTMQNLKVLAIGSVQTAQAAPVKESAAPEGGKPKEAVDKIAPTQGLITLPLSARTRSS